MKNAERFAATSVRLRTDEPGTNGELVRASISTKEDSIATDAANSPAVDAEPQPTLLAQLTA